MENGVAIGYGCPWVRLAQRLQRGQQWAVWWFAQHPTVGAQPNRRAVHGSNVQRRGLRSRGAGGGRAGGHDEQTQTPSSAPSGQSASYHDQGLE